MLTLKSVKALPLEERPASMSYEFIFLILHICTASIDLSDYALILIWVRLY